MGDHGVRGMGLGKIREDPGALLVNGAHSRQVYNTLGVNWMLVFQHVLGWQVAATPARTPDLTDAGPLFQRWGRADPAVYTLPASGSKTFRERRHPRY